MNISHLLDACRVLFNQDINLSKDFLQNLESSILKEAYRKKAFETHPDRSAIIGINETELEKRFKEVYSAYEILRPYAEGEERVLYKARDTRRERTSKVKGVNDHFFKGVSPRNELLIGQYLYYSGIISWKTLIRGIVWQKKQRPLFGQIARDWEILSPFEINRILLEKNFKEKIGEFALRRGYITPFQQMAIIGKQRMMHRLIGEYFVESGFLSRKQMNDMIIQNQLRNMKIRRNK